MVCKLNTLSQKSRSVYQTKNVRSKGCLIAVLATYHVSLLEIDTLQQIVILEGKTEIIIIFRRITNVGITKFNIFIVI